MEKEKELKLAVLIDADNIPYSYVRDMMEEIAKYGIATVKRIYGDWTDNRLSGWKKVLLENAISPVQQYAYTRGKNATDSAMIIDAMDILYSGNVDGFCLVSSDSDFTRLATRLRESGKTVIGLGEKKTPEPFIVACDKFIYLEILQNLPEKGEEKSGNKKKTTPRVSAQERKRLLNQLRSTINDLSDDNGWAFLGEVGSLLMKKYPDFDPRNYGFPKLTPLIKSIQQIEVDERETDRKNVKLVFIRNK